MMRKIISSDQDLSAVVLYNTKESKNNIDVPGIYILQELERPGAEKVLQLEELMGSKFTQFISGSEKRDFNKKSLVTFMFQKLCEVYTFENSCNV